MVTSAEAPSRRPVTGLVGWLVKVIFGYGSAVFLAVLTWLAIKGSPDAITAEQISESFGNWGLGLPFYLFLQGLLILVVTGGRNIGKDWLSMLDTLVSLIPGGVLMLIVYGNMDAPERHPLSAHDWSLVKQIGITVFVDIVIFGWLGHRVSRLMGETHISNR